MSLRRFLVNAFYFRPQHGGRLCQGHSAEYQYCYSPVSLQQFDKRHKTVALSVILLWLIVSFIAKTTFSAIETLLFTHCVMRYEVYFEIRTDDYRAFFKRASQGNRVCIGFATLLSVIGQQNLCSCLIR